METSPISADATLAEPPTGAGSTEFGPLFETMARVQLSIERKLVFTQEVGTCWHLFDK